MTGTSEPEPGREPAAGAPAPEPYGPPRLTRHGTIEDLTGGVAGPIVGDPNG